MSTLSSVGQKLLRYGPWPVAVSVWVLVFNYAPSPLYTNDEFSKYLASTSLAIGAGGILWGIGELVRGRQDRAVSIETPDATSHRPVPVAEVSAAITSSFNTADDGSALGWCHYLGAYSQHQSASVLSSAFALRILMLTSFESRSISPRAVTSWIRTKAKEDGGWSAQSQREYSRPEVTAIVAGALSRLDGLDEDLRKASRSIEDAVESGSDPLATTDTYVVATILEESPFLEINKKIINTLIEKLIDGAIKLSENQYCWAESLKRTNRGAPSTPMTAHAVLALQSLQKSGHYLDSTTLSIMHGSLDWLKDADLNNVSTKLVRYPNPGVEEVNAPRHFTSALVSIALFQAGRGMGPEAAAALERSWLSYRDGVWVWDSGDAPIYMTFYGYLAAVTGALA